MNLPLLIFLLIEPCFAIVILASSFTSNLGVSLKLTNAAFDLELIILNEQK